MNEQALNSDEYNRMTFEQALSEAAEWRVRLDDESTVKADHQAFKKWLASDDMNRRAWLDIAATWEALAQAKRPGARVAIEQSYSEEKHEKQRLLKKSVLGLALMICLPISWLTITNTTPSYWLADYRTATGEQRTITLADGSILNLNTATAVNLEYSQTERRIVLHQGELHIDVASDSTRPLTIITKQGSAEALGTRYSVRYYKDYMSDSESQELVKPTTAMQVKVYESNVQVCEVHEQTCLELFSGQQLFVHANSMNEIESFDNNDRPAWITGRLNMIDMPVNEVLDELSRYYSGILYFDDEAFSKLRVSGTIPLDDVSRALDALSITVPIKYEYFSPLFIAISPTQL